ncbi:AAA ATPase [Tilletia horrida]|nr:AAA ATPase [Tilletia horrida]
MPVTRTLRSSLGEHNAQHGTSATSTIELPLAKTREVRQAAMGSPYAPTSPKVKHMAPPAAAGSAAAAAARRPEFGTLVPNGLPGGIRSKFARTESMPIINHIAASDDDEASQDDLESSSPISTRTRTAMKQASTSPHLPSSEQLTASTATTSTSSSSSRRTGAVKRSAAESNTPAASSGSSSGQNASSTSSHRGEDPAPDDDDGDEDDPRRRRRRSSRLGGCSSQSEPRRERDDSNKENIAPPNYRRSEIEVVIELPRNAAQSQLGMRTRTMTRRSVSSPVIHFSSSNASNVPSAAAASVRRSARRSGLSRTDSFGSGRNPSPNGIASGGPTTPSRRSRGGPLSPAVNEASAPASPFARLNLGAGSSAFGLGPSLSANASLADDAESSYFSSQGSASVAPSIFDSTSQFAEEDSYMDDGSHGYLPTTRRARGLAADGSQESSIYSRASSMMPDMDILPESGPGEEADEIKADAETSAANDVEMQEVDTTAEGAECVEDSKPTSPKKPRYPNVYAHARALLRFSSQAAEDSETSASSSAQGEENEARDQVQIVGRTREGAAIKTFLSAQFEAEALFESSDSAEQTSTKEKPIEVETSAPSLYICGMPGTGKTALVRSVLSELRLHGSTAPQIAFVNCMSIRAPRLIFGRILAQLGEESPDDSDPLSTEAESALDEALKKSKRHILIVLDEIDHLLEKRAHQNVLQRLFCIGKSAAASSNKSAKCAVIGIANSLDLTERFLPLLATTAMAPTVLHMQPFTADDIVKVVRSRLTGLYARYDLGADEEAQPAQKTDDAIFKKPALELASKRISAQTGDLRKALALCRLAVEHVEAEQRQGAINVMTTEETARKVVAAELLANLTPETAPRVMPQHILRVLSSVLGNSQVSRVRQLGKHAKFFLLGYIVAERRKAEGLQVLGRAVDDKLARAVGGGSATLRAGMRYSEVQMTYASLLKTDGQFEPLLTSELLQVVEGLETDGIVALSNDTATAPGGGSGSAPSGAAAQSKRGGKKAHPHAASNPSLALILSQEEILDGLTTAAPPSALAAAGSGAAVAAAAAGGTANAVHAVLAETISKMWRYEEGRILRARGWEAAALESEAVRREELGGGRGFQPIGL